MSATPAAAPHVAHPTLPPALLRGTRLLRSLRFPVTLEALLHLFVDLPQRQSAGAFQFVRIGVIYHNNGLILTSWLDLATPASETGPSLSVLRPTGNQPSSDPAQLFDQH